jgi:uncharacterized membrane protein
MDKYLLLRFVHLVGLMLMSAGLIGVFVADMRSRQMRDVTLLAQAVTFVAVFYDGLVVPGALLLLASGTWLIVDYHGGWGFLGTPWLAGMVFLFAFEFIEGNTITRLYFMRLRRLTRAAVAEGRVTAELAQARGEQLASFTHFLDIPLLLVIVSLGALRPTDWTHFIVTSGIALIVASALNYYIPRLYPWGGERLAEPLSTRGIPQLQMNDSAGQGLRRQNDKPVGLLHVGGKLRQQLVGGDAYRACEAFADLGVDFALDGECQASCNRVIALHLVEPAGHLVDRHDVFNRNVPVDGREDAMVVFDIDLVPGLYELHLGTEPPRLVHEGTGLDAEGLRGIACRYRTRGLRHSRHDDDRLASVLRILLLLAGGEETVEIENKPAQHRVPHGLTLVADSRFVRTAEERPRTRNCRL